MDIVGIDYSRQPLSAGLFDQMRQNSNLEEKWLESILIEGRIPFRHGGLTDEYTPQTE